MLTTKIQDKLDPSQGKDVSLMLEESDPTNATNDYLEY